MTEAEWPYSLPIWRRFYRAQSPDGKHVAQIDPAYELTMGNPTWGILCISSGPHIERCNPSFVCAVHWRCKVFPMWDSPSSTHKRGRWGIPHGEYFASPVDRTYETRITS